MATFKKYCFIIISEPMSIYTYIFIVSYVTYILSLATLWSIAYNCKLATIRPLRLCLVLLANSHCLFYQLVMYQLPAAADQYSRSDTSVPLLWREVQSAMGNQETNVSRSTTHF